jgi:hypothetical protein
MAANELLAVFPTRVQASSRSPDLWYERVPDLFALHGQIPASLRTAAVYELNEGAIVVLRGAPGREPVAPAIAAVTPVYALRPNGPPAVPTGLVFVRFAERVAIDERRDQLAQAGYNVAEVPAYAPHAAWVRASHGGIATSLAGIAALAGIADVVSVEPQMLSASARR